MSGEGMCGSCGAPDGGETVLCRFCQQAISPEIRAQAIPCPNQQCRTLNRWGKQKCVRCQGWIVVSCVFCGSLSPCSVSNCVSCNEAFAGAPQRKAQIEAQRAQQQNMQQANMLVSMLGVAAGAGALASSFHHSNSSSSFDFSSGDSDGITGFSGMSDDATFDFGGGDD